jgi:hypothetical protein
MTKLVVAFRNFANAPTSQSSFISEEIQLITYNNHTSLSYVHTLISQRMPRTQAIAYLGIDY